MITPRRDLLQLGSPLADLAAVQLAYWTAYILRFDLQLGGPPPGPPSVTIYGLTAVLFTGVFVSLRAVRGDYEPAAFIDRAGLWIWRGLLPTVSIFLGVVFFVRTTQTAYSRLTFGLFVGLLLLTLPLMHGLLRLGLARSRRLAGPARAVLLVGSGTVAERLVAALPAHLSGDLALVGALNDDPADAVPGVPYLGPVADLTATIERTGAQVVLLALCGADRVALPEAIRICLAEGVELSIVPEEAGALAGLPLRIESVGGVPLFNIRQSPLESLGARMLKRAFDLLFSLAVLVFGAPVFLAVALAVRLSSPGPIFFRQERVGLNRRRFRVWKFRTMRVQGAGQSDTRWTVRDDPRVTPIGGWLRRTNLDELPQFWNVLVGEMSVVGPRPERPHFVNQFRSEIGRYMARHQAKAGITGWAQVLGYRGDTSIARRIEADLYYIEHWSFWLDLKIILATVTRTGRDPNAY